MTNCLPKLLITGANGQLASALRQHPLALNYEMHSYARTQLDITDITAVEHTLTQLKPDVVINTAAYTAVDNAEHNQKKALQINCEGIKNLATICKKNKIALIHLSTDYVFDGLKTSAYCEEDCVNPINYYGKSKWLGEQILREENPNHLILRVSGIFSEYGHNFVKTILRLAREKKELRIVADQITCPTQAHDIANALFQLMAQQAKGTYHFCSNDPVSWHDFTVAVFAEAKRYQAFTNKITAISTREYLTAAKRPLYSVLDCNKIKKDFTIAQPSWKKGIERVIAKLLAEKN